MQYVWEHRFRRSTLYLWLFVSVLAGLGLARTGPGWGLALCWLVLPLLLATLRRRSILTLVIVIVLGIGAGWWRGDVFMQRLAVYEPLYFQKITITIRATEDAVYDQKTKQLTFGAGYIVLENGQRIAGKMQVSGFGINSVYQGDEIIATGKLYPGYGAQQARMSFAQMELVARHPSLLPETRRQFVAGAQTALPEPLGPFVMGLLVGLRDTLPQQTKDDLQHVGLTHIIAVSGANLTIILQASQRLLGKRSKRLSTALTFSLIGVFLILSGASASIVRAAMVSTLSIVTSYYGRNLKPLNLIMMAAAITAWANPVYIWSDLSWYLSFLAFSGILILAPLLQVRLPAKLRANILGSVALETICAEVMTLPFVLHIFGQMSRVSLLANILVVSFIPIAMLLGAVAGLAGMLASHIAGWFAWPAIVVLNYMLDVARILANLPDIFVEGIGLTLAQMLGVYVCIALFILLLWYKQPDKNAILTEMNPMNRRGLLA